MELGLLQKKIFGFNIELAEDINVDEAKKVKIITNPVIYKIIEDFEEWKQAKLKEIERAKLEELPVISKIKILDFVFRNSNPAIFGVCIEGGTLKKGTGLINKQDIKIGKVKTIQEDKNNIPKAEQGKEVAISIPGVNFERQLEKNEILYNNLSETQFRKFKEGFAGDF